MLPITKTTKSTHKRKEKLFSSSDSDESDCDNLNTPPLNLQGNRPKMLADKAIAPDVSSSTVKNLIGDSALRRTDKAIKSNPSLVSMGTGALDDTGSDSSSSDHSGSMLPARTKSVLPNVVHNDTVDITSFAYDETLLAENNKVRSICLVSLKPAVVRKG